MTRGNTAWVTIAIFGSEDEYSGTKEEVKCFASERLAREHINDNDLADELLLLKVVSRWTRKVTYEKEDLS